MILCKECKHLNGVGICIRPVPVKGIDYVYGAFETALCRYARDERNEDSQNSCGPEATYFERKEKL